MRVGYSNPLKDSSWPRAGRGSGNIAQRTAGARKWMDTAGNMWAVGKVLSGWHKDKYGLFVKTGHHQFNLNAHADASDLELTS